MIKSHAINVQPFLANLLIVYMNELNKAGTCMNMNELNKAGTCRKDMQHVCMSHVLATYTHVACPCDTHDTRVSLQYTQGDTRMSL